MKLGDAFLMPDSSQSRHLYIVISDPATNAGTFVIVNITGDRFRTAQECVLNVGDHPWIKKTSYVAFSDALEITPIIANKLNKRIATNIIKLQPSLESKVLERIISAAKVSTALAENLKKYL
jgi:hypothetical protein